VAHLEVDVVAADRRVWRGDARMVSAPAADGDIGILPGHTPVLAVLRAGVVRITSANGSLKSVGVDEGFLSVDDDKVMVVVHAATEAGADAGRGRGR
jgi:F-type H+-transporting ATPase subunit epsilon